MLQKISKRAKLSPRSSPIPHTGLVLSKGSAMTIGYPIHPLSDSAVLEHLQPEPFLGAPGLDGTFKSKTTEDGRKDQMGKQHDIENPSPST